MWRPNPQPWHTVRTAQNKSKGADGDGDGDGGIGGCKRTESGQHMSTNPSIKPDRHLQVVLACAWRQEPTSIMLGIQVDAVRNEQRCSCFGVMSGICVLHPF
jgi:hypothetical protein